MAYTVNSGEYVDSNMSAMHGKSNSKLVIRATRLVRSTATTTIQLMNMLRSTISKYIHTAHQVDFLRRVRHPEHKSRAETVKGSFSTIAKSLTATIKFPHMTHSSTILRFP